MYGGPATCGLGGMLAAMRIRSVARHTRGKWRGGKENPSFGLRADAGDQGRDALSRPFVINIVRRRPASPTCSDLQVRDPGAEVRVRPRGMGGAFFPSPALALTRWSGGFGFAGANLEDREGYLNNPREAVKRGLSGGSGGQRTDAGRPGKTLDPGRSRNGWGLRRNGDKSNGQAASRDFGGDGIVARLSLNRCRIQPKFGHIDAWDGAGGARGVVIADTVASPFVVGW